MFNIPEGDCLILAMLGVSMLALALIYIHNRPSRRTAIIASLLAKRK